METCDETCPKNRIPINVNTNVSHIAQPPLTTSSDSPTPENLISFTDDVEPDIYSPIRDLQGNSGNSNINISDYFIVVPASAVPGQSLVETNPDNIGHISESSMGSENEIPPSPIGNLSNAQALPLSLTHSQNDILQLDINSSRGSLTSVDITTSPVVPTTSIRTPHIQ